jgi:DNA polymerase-3 subunit gamma/tau
MSDMSESITYEVTATKRRPRSFDDLIGQEFVVSTLKNSLESGRIAHAYLFAGPRGVGKTSAARILAKSLNCGKGPIDTPCDDCVCCEEINRGASLDVIEIDGASNTSVNDVREIKDEVLFAPNSSRYKIYIIDEVHMLSNSAFNALLKTIEEPPPYIVFVFATTEIHKVPATIRSRCQQFNFRLIPTEQISESLRRVCTENGIQAEEDALFWIAKEATGSLRDAYTLFDQVVSFSGDTITLETIRKKLGLVGLDRINELAELLAAGNIGGSLETLDGIIRDGVAVEQFVIDMTEFFRNLLLIKNGIDRQSILGYAPSRFSETARQSFTVPQIEHAIGLLLELYRNIRYSLNQRYELELVVSRLAALTDFIPRGELLRRIAELKGGLVQGGGDGGTRGEAGGFTRVTGGSGGRKEPHGEVTVGTGSEEAAAWSEGVEDTTVGDSASGTPSGDGSVGSAEVPGGLPWEEIINALKKTKVALSSSLEKAVDKRLEGGVLTLTFPSAYTKNCVADEIQTVSNVVEQVLGRQVAIEMNLAKEDAPSGEETEAIPNEQIDAVKKIFKGEILQGE